MENWDEVRTAYHVARMGTVSGAAEALGVHHATVIRHVDALEARLGVKLFQRHARGYAPTEAGQDLLRVAGATDDQLQQLAGRLRGQGDTASGELIVTSLMSFSPVMVPALTSFQAKHPDVQVRYIADERLFRLEFGEAHVAIRAGLTPPEDPDNVVQRLCREGIALYGSPDYLAQFGRPTSAEALEGHRFVGHENPEHRSPAERWLRSRVQGNRVVFRSADVRVQAEAVQQGAGLGFLPETLAKTMGGLEQVIAPQDEWSADFWVVTHVDLHRTAKVQAFVTHLKEAVLHRN